jgi:dimethylargininase
VIGEHRRLVRIEAPATLEGGDVLRVGRTLYVGRSVRTDDAGIAALAAHAVPAGYRVVPVPVRECLHLKTACTALDAGTLLANPAWVDPAAFAGMRVVEVDPREPFGANTLGLGGRICVSASNPRTAARIGALGFPVIAIDIGELEKAEAGLTCLSVLIEG